MAPDTSEIAKDIDEVYRCVERISPELRTLVNDGCGSDVLLWALQMNFAEMVRDCSGDDTTVVNLKGFCMKLSRTQQDRAQACHQHIKNVRENLHKDGIANDSIMWSLIGAVRNLSRAADIPENQIEQCMTAMIKGLKAAHRPLMN
jgi:hypothetical protein